MSYFLSLYQFGSTQSQAISRLLDTFILRIMRVPVTSGQLKLTYLIMTFLSWSLAWLWQPRPSKGVKDSSIKSKMNQLERV